MSERPARPDSGRCRCAQCRAAKERERTDIRLRIEESAAAEAQNGGAIDLPSRSSS